MKALLYFVLGLVIGAAVYWYVVSQPHSKISASSLSRTETRTNATDTGQTTKNNFNTETIKDELARTGKVIREKSEQAGRVIADATADARTTATIKGKLIKDTGLSAFKIDVNTTAGTVTLAGTVSSYDEIVRAMRIALDTEGVQRVVSTLQIKA
jgi:hypothetical protein